MVTRSREGRQSLCDTSHLTTTCAAKSVRWLQRHVALCAVQFASVHPAPDHPAPPPPPPPPPSPASPPPSAVSSDAPEDEPLLARADVADCQKRHAGRGCGQRNVKLYGGRSTTVPFAPSSSGSPVSSSSPELAVSVESVTAVARSVRAQAWRAGPNGQAKDRFCPVALQRACAYSRGAVGSVGSASAEKSPSITIAIRSAAASPSTTRGSPLSARVRLRETTPRDASGAPDAAYGSCASVTPHER